MVYSKTCINPSIVLLCTSKHDVANMAIVLEGIFGNIYRPAACNVYTYCFFLVIIIHFVYCSQRIQSFTVRIASYMYSNQQVSLLADCTKSCWTRQYPIDFKCT